MSSQHWKRLVLLLVLASFFRFFGTFDSPGYLPTTDEGIHVPNAISLGTYGTTDKLNWQHPQLSGLILYGTIKLFGNNPVGWRISNALFGTASVLLVYLIGILLFSQSHAPLLAAGLLAMDPFHIYLSRTTFVEVPASFFFLLYLYFMLAHSEKGRLTLPLAGIALGLTIATKAYFVLAIPLVFFFSLYRARQEARLSPALCVDYIFALLLLPLSVALLSYIQWFGRGYTLPEFFRMKLDAIWAMQQYMKEEFTSAFMHAGGRPWEWFVRPIILGEQLFSDGARGRFILEMNNFPFRVLSLPSIVVTALYAWQKKSLKEALAPLLFAACYLLFLAVRRPIFSYSALVLLPFAYLTTGRTVELLARKSGRSNLVLGCFFFAVTAWGIYTFPLVSGRTVPLSLYRPVLSSAYISGAN